ncbi:hypothetical protein [Xanthobacter autotrophicus]|uniref:hypothetical protein n=1 Tax=Xanthobacter autotrophicus TaxID=280 RepID=UPI00372B2A5F
MRLEIHDARARLIRSGYRVVRMGRCLCVYKTGVNVAIYINNGSVPEEPVVELESA